MKVGDFVKYFNEAYPSSKIGMVVSTCDNQIANIRVLWLDHTPTTRDWYTVFELRKVCK